MSKTAIDRVVELRLEGITVEFKDGATHIDHRSHVRRSFRQLGGMVSEMRKLVFLSSLEDDPRSFTDSLQRKQIFNIRCHDRVAVSLCRGQGLKMVGFGNRQQERRSHLPILHLVT